MQISYSVCTFDAQNLINSSVCGHGHSHQVSSSYVLRNLRYRVHKVCDADDADDNDADADTDGDARHLTDSNIPLLLFKPGDKNQFGHFFDKLSPLSYNMSYISIYYRTVPFHHCTTNTLLQVLIPLQHGQQLCLLLFCWFFSL